MKGLLEIQIKDLREKMEETAKKKGLTDPEVIAISQEIDQLHNQWNLHRPTKGSPYLRFRLELWPG